jgi:hypothetical protein
MEYITKLATSQSHYVKLPPQNKKYKYYVTYTSFLAYALYIFLLYVPNCQMSNISQVEIQQSWLKEEQEGQS